VSPKTVAAETGEQLEQLQARLLGLEEQVSELSLRLDNAVSALVKLTQHLRNQSGAAKSSEPAAPRNAANETSPAEVTPRMLEVVRLVQQGKGEEAQAQLQALPQAELAAQPAIVALVAATLCLQRVDIQACLKALKRARGFTSDPRLLKVLERVEGKAQAHSRAT
jgi:hypothetical protein